MTIEEIARTAGVSPATVSRVFSHHPNIRPDVREQVLEIARKAGYHPRVSDKQKNVVVIVPFDAVFPVQSCVDMLLMALMRELPVRGFRVEILPVNNLKRLNSIQFCGAASIGCDPEVFRGWNDHFASPLFVVDRKLPESEPGICTVRSDEEQGMELAIEYLYRRGCRNIGCIIHGEADSGNASIRRAAVETALKKRLLPHSDRMIYFSGLGTERYMELTGKLLKQNADALFCPGGNAGILEMYALDLLDKKVPSDISLIASEQTFFSAFAVPPQTTLTQDYPGIAKAVADGLVRWIDGVIPEQDVLLPYRLIERESVR